MNGNENQPALPGNPKSLLAEATRILANSNLRNDEKVRASFFDKVNRSASVPPEAATVAAARQVAGHGPRTLDAKWLDPECWDGCQSLLWKHLLERVLEWCEQESPNFEIDADAIRKALGKKESEQSAVAPQIEGGKGGYAKTTDGLLHGSVAPQKERKPIFKTPPSAEWVEKHAKEDGPEIIGPVAPQKSLAVELAGARNRE